MTAKASYFSCASTILSRFVPPAPVAPLVEDPASVEPGGDEVAEPGAPPAVDAEPVDEEPAPTDDEPTP